MSEWPPLHWSRGQIGSEEEQDREKEKGRQKEVKGTIDSNGHPRPLTGGSYKGNIFHPALLFH